MPMLGLRSESFPTFRVCGGKSDVNTDQEQGSRARQQANSLPIPGLFMINHTLPAQCVTACPLPSGPDWLPTSGGATR